MIVNSIKQNNSDTFGALASGLCLMHCIITPFIFIAQSGAADNLEVPIWWGTIDIILIIISFFAVYWSAKNSGKQWVTIGLWLCWALVSIVILNEKIGLIELPESSIYAPAIGLIVLHIYNRKYCKCEDNNFKSVTN